MADRWCDDSSRRRRADGPRAGRFWSASFLSGHLSLAQLWGLSGAVGRDRVLRVFSWQPAVGRRALAERDQFRRRDRVYFADLVILPILDIYRRYYGSRMSWFLLCTLYIAMAGAAYVIGTRVRGARMGPGSSRDAHG